MKTLSGFIVHFLFVALAVADNPSVVILRGNSTCGSGFVFEGEIVTNAHLVSSLCPLGDCEGLKIDGINCTKWSVSSLKRSLDLGSLNCREPIEKPSLTLGSSDDSNVTIVGYPRCGEQKTSSGEIIQKSRLHLILTAKGNYGSSGSPILNPEGKVVGIIDQAASAKSLLQSKILFQSEFPMRGINAKNLKYIKGDNFEDISQILLDYYRQIGRNLSGIDRLLFSFDFLARVEGFNFDIVESGEPALLLGYLEQIPLASNYTPLVFAATLEGRGPYFKPFKYMTNDLERKIITGKTNFEELYNGLNTNPYAGLELTMIKYSLILLISVFIIGLSLGVVLSWIWRRYRR